MSTKSYEGLFMFCRINVYGFECFICVLHLILSIFFQHCYHLVEILPDLESWSTNLVLGRQWISEDICGRLLMYAFPCAWNILIVVCTLFLSITWHGGRTFLRVDFVWLQTSSKIKIFKIQNNRTSLRKCGMPSCF